MCKKKLMSLMCFVLMLGFVGSAFGTDWNGAGGDNLWKTDGVGGNWSDAAAPLLADDAIFYWYGDPGADVIIDNGTAATCNDLNGLGWNAGQHGSVTVQKGGSLEVGNMTILGQLGPASMYVDGGTVTDGSVLGNNELRVGQGQDGSPGVNEGYGGYLKINQGGSVTANTIYLPLTSGTGHIQLDDGVLTSTNWMAIGAGGTMDIGGGKFVIGWVDLEWMQTTYQPFIDSGQITGWGGTGTATIAYEEGVGATITATPGVTSPYLITSPQSLSVAELGTTSATYDVSLNTNPGAGSTVSVTINDPDPNVLGIDLDVLGIDPSEIDLGSGAGVPITLTFNDSDWYIPQTVTVTAVDDVDLEGLETIKVLHFLSQSVGVDPNDYVYNQGRVSYADVSVDIDDDDMPEIIITEVDGTTVGEDGTTDTYTVHLDADPIVAVAITVDPNASGTGYLEVNGAGASNSIVLNFDSGNYSTPIVVTVTAVEDDINNVFGAAERTATISHVAASAGDYDSVSNDLTVTIIDDDCGSWGFDSMDFNHDCYVGLADFADFVVEWMFCTDPQEPGSCDDILTTPR